jgi:RimJ/RimL family protein N-acetyltransferase
MGDSPPAGPPILREVREEDLPIFFEHQRDPEAVRMAVFPSRDLEAFMAHWRKIMADAAVLLRTVEVEGLVAGNVVSFMRGGEREVGYWIGREFWGRGIATRALEAFLLEERTRPLFAGAATGNVASLRVLEKCGFVPCRTEGDEVVLRLG